MQRGTLRRYLRHGMLPQLRVLEAVARHGSFTRAAEELHMAQPTVSLHIKKLTQTIGTPLLEHVGKRMHPTAAGRALCAACEEILSSFARFDDTLSDLRELNSGTLRISVGSSEKYIVLPLIAEFARRYPAIDTSVQVLARDSALARLIEDSDDVCLVSEPPQSTELETLPIYPNPFLVFARSDRSLTNEKPIPFARFAQEPLLVREQGSAARAVAERVFETRGAVPRVRMELGSNEAVKEAMLSGLGLAILARFSMGLDMPRELAPLDVEGFPVESHACLVRPEGKHLSPAAQAFCQMVKVETKGLLGGAVPSRARRSARARDEAPRSLTR
jgi:DNA-binding transcriptional LysR family regulator